MKKILAALLSGILTVSALSGCGTYTTDETSTSTGSSDSSTSADSSATSGESEGTTSGEGSTFTFIGGNPVTLNPILSQSTDDGNTFYLLQ